MYLTTHAAAGMVIARAIGNPVGSFGTGILSHYILDTIPHGDEIVSRWVDTTPKKALVVGLMDLVVLTMVFVAIFMRSENPWLLLAGAAGAILPDIVGNIVPFVHRNVTRLPGFSLSSRSGQQLRRAHDWIHQTIHNPAKIKIGFVFGILAQIGVSGLLLYRILGF